MEDVATTITSLLPEAWSRPECFEDVIDADGLRLHRVGLSSAREGTEALGSAADGHGSPKARAAYELLERVSTLEACRAERQFPVRSRSGDVTGAVPAASVFPVSGNPSVWTYAKSNGVALYSDWTGACERAELELIERDSILAAWLGQTEPRRLRLDSSVSPLPATRSYEWSTYAFPRPCGDVLAPGVHVVGAFGFPCAPSAPFVCGYAARGSLQAAAQVATREALQLLAFLWGEPVGDRAPEPTPTPMCHLETYQCRERQALLRHWLEGAHRPYGIREAFTRDPADAVRFVDLTPPWLEGRMHVAKAVSGSVLPLAFGLSPVTARLPVELRLHPIP